MQRLIDRTHVIIAMICLTIGTIFYVAGCGGALKKMSGDFATCAQADLGQMITPGPDGALAGLTPAELIQFVGEIISRNTDALEAQLAALAKIVTLDAIECAIAAIDAVLSTPSGSAAPTPQVATPGLVRAKAWVAKQHAAQHGAAQ